jgi:putative ABC transport system substrate-binding protein
LTSFGSELAAKRLELLKDTLPRARRVSVLLGRASSVALNRQEAEKIAAKSLKLELQHVEVRGPDEFETAFSAMAKRKVDAVVISDDPMLHANEKRIADIAARQRLPSAGRLELPEAGGLLGYAPNVADNWRRAAVFVDKILKGAKPGELPIERPTKFELVINMKTAKALGIKIPQSILVRADRVIE